MPYLLIHIYQTIVIIQTITGELNKEKNAYEVKIKKEHATSLDSESINNLEPITSETSNNNSQSPNVVVDKTQGGCQAKR